MAIHLPSEPVFANESEQEVWRFLDEQLPADAVLVTNVMFTGERDFEVDLVVAWPDLGVAVIEVKGGLVTHDGAQWWQSDRTSRRPIDPVWQAQVNRHALKKYVEARWSAGDLRAAWFVALPHAQLPPGFDATAAPRERIFDASDMPTIADRIRSVLAAATSPPSPSAETCRLLGDHLVGRFEPQAHWVGLRRLREEQVDRLTAEQFAILTLMARANRYAVFGPAGSGKTFLALEQARRLAASGQRVAMLCYSRGLSRYLARMAERWEPDERPAYIGTFHRLASQWGVKPPVAAPSEWWEVESAETLRAVAESLPASERFDSIVVDEAQDFGPAWWSAVQAALVDPDHGGLILFADADQAVFGRDASALPPLTPLNLSVNVRNSEPIARGARVLASDPVEHLGVSGPEVVLIDVPMDDALSAADDEVDLILAAGWDPVDIALLTTGSRHPVQVERAGDNADAYWDSLWENDDIFYGHVLSFKGLERPVVILALNDWKRPEHARELLYVGLTRARDQLVICGPRAELERLGGAALLDALRV